MTSDSPQTTRQHGVSRYALVVAALLLVLAAVASALLNAYRAILDDAFISFRYARNIAAGCGPAFNCGGEWVEGFTSPLYVAMLSVGAVFTDDLETVATSLGMLGGIVGLVLTLVWVGKLLAESGARRTDALVSLAAVVFAVDGFLTVQLFAGMEIWLGWIAAATVALLAHRNTVFVAVTSAAILVRPEFGAFIPFLFLFPRLRTLRTVGTVAAVLLMITGLRFALFGEVLPNTFYVKSGGTVRHFLAGLDYLVGAFLQYPLIVFAPLALLLRHARREVGFVLGGAAVWFAFQLRSGGDFYDHARMLLPLVPMLSVLGLVGAFAVGRLVARVLGRYRVVELVVWAALALLFCVYAVKTPNRFLLEINNERGDVWAETGTWLRETLPPDSSVATAPIGAIGYFSGLEVIDLIGLTDTAIGREGDRIDDSYDYLAIGHETYHTEEVLRRRPTAIVFLQIREDAFDEDPNVPVGMPAEADLLSTIGERDLPYVVTTPQITDEHRMLILLQREVARRVYEGPTWPVADLVVDYRSPRVRYPWLTLLGFDPEA